MHYNHHPTSEVDEARQPIGTKTWPNHRTISRKNAIAAENTDVYHSEQSSATFLVISTACRDMTSNYSFEKTDVNLKESHQQK